MVNIGRGEVVQRLVHALVVVVLHKLAELVIQMPGQIIVLQIDDVFHGAMIAFNLALGHGMIRSRANMLDMVALEILFELIRNKAGAII